MEETQLLILKHWPEGRGLLGYSGVGDGELSLRLAEQVGAIFISFLFLFFFLLLPLSFSLSYRPQQVPSLHSLSASLQSVVTNFTLFSGHSPGHQHLPERAFCTHLVLLFLFQIW